MEIVRFGPGFRKTHPATGAQGLADQTIWADPRARITELAFGPRAVLPPQTSPDQGILIVVSGGGWVQVGDERTAVHHGEALEWPSGVAHAAWTDGSEMRAILVELPEEVAGVAHRRVAEGEARGSQAARGRLAERPPPPAEQSGSEGEPW